RGIRSSQCRRSFAVCRSPYARSLETSRTPTVSSSGSTSDPRVDAMAAWRTTDATQPDTGNTPHDRYVLRLFVAGMTARSTRAVENIRTLCEQYLPGAYNLEVINLYEQPVLASGEQIIAAPTRVRRIPVADARVHGHMANGPRALH